MAEPTKMRGVTQARTRRRPKGYIEHERHQTENGMSRQAAHNTLAWENKSTKWKYEHMTSFEQDSGDKIHETKGGKHSVRFPKIYAIDSIVTHNHPESSISRTSLAGRIGSPFSPADLRSAMLSNNARIRARTANFVYDFSRPKGGWPKMDTLNEIKNAGQLNRAVRQHMERRGLNPSARENQEYFYRTLFAMAHEQTLAYAKKHGIRYTWRRVGK